MKRLTTIALLIALLAALAPAAHAQIGKDRQTVEQFGAAISGLAPEMSTAETAMQYRAIVARAAAVFDDYDRSLARITDLDRLNDNFMDFFGACAFAKMRIDGADTAADSVYRAIVAEIDRTAAGVARATAHCRVLRQYIKEVKDYFATYFVGCDNGPIHRHELPEREPKKARTDDAATGRPAPRPQDAADAAAAAGSGYRPDEVTEFLAYYADLTERLERAADKAQFAAHMKAAAPRLLAYMRSTAPLTGHYRRSLVAYFEALAPRCAMAQYRVSADSRAVAVIKQITERRRYPDTHPDACVMNGLIDALPQMKKALEGAARRADTLGEFFGNLMAVVQDFTDRVEQAKGKLEIK